MDMRETPPKRSFWLWPSVAGGVFLVIVAVFWGLALMSMGGDRSSFASFRSNQIAVVDLTGTIDSADTINDQLEGFANDTSVKAIILHIDSPGGGAAASQEIYHEVLRIRTEHKKRIVASIESVGASGAYYVASATDRIYANQASIVGSIGVIAQWVNYGDLLQWAKLKDVTIKAGALKDAGSPTRDLTPEERAYFQALIDNMHLQFIADVALGRHLTVQQVQPLATGQVWTGQQALPLHLIDQTGGFHEALMDTARAVGIRGEPAIVRPERPRHGLLDAILGAGSRSLFPSPDALIGKAPGFYFLWK
jgi:protease-4